IEERVQVIRRRDDYERDRDGFAVEWKREESKVRNAIKRAKGALPSVEVPDAALARAAELCLALGTDGLRGELTLIRAARAFAALTKKKKVSDVELQRVAPLALRHRLRRDPLDEAGSTVRVDRAVAEVFAP
ncbi:MAG: magnesium chelatase ATPase subunit I, partial [Myxococcota bacterium]